MSTQELLDHFGLNCIRFDWKSAPEEALGEARYTWTEQHTFLENELFDELAATMAGNILKAL